MQSRRTYRGPPSHRAPTLRLLQPRAHETLEDRIQFVHLLDSCGQRIKSAELDELRGDFGGFRIESSPYPNWPLGVPVILLPAVYVVIGVHKFLRD